MTTPYPNQINLLSDGQPVSAGTFNGPLSGIIQRTVALNEQITNAMIGSAVVLPSVAMEGDNVKPGMAVYSDSTGVYKPGLASIGYASDGYTIVPAPCAYVWGIVQSKNTTTSGTVITSGSVRFTEAQLRSILLIGALDPIPTGLLFLSATPDKQGYLTPIKPPIGVTVGVLRGPDGVDASGNSLYTLIVNIGWKDFMEGHIHYHVKLQNYYASSNASSNPNDFWESAAAYTSRTGKAALAGALYRYRHDLDTNLNTLWPPIPIGSVAYELDGITEDLIAGDYVVVNNDGIWWTNSHYGPHLFRHDFYFTKMTFQTGKSVVTSITAGDNSVAITDLDGKSASTGDLKLNFNVALSTNDVTPNGKALKSLNNLVFGTGPVIDGIRVSGGSVYVTGSNNFTYNTKTYQSGLIDISIADPSSREGTVNFVDISNLVVESVNGIDVLTFKRATTAVLKCKFTIPSTGVGSSLSAKIQFIVWPRATGTMTDLAATYLRIPKPSLSPSVSTLSTSYAAVSGGLALSGIGAVSNTSTYALFEMTLPGTYAAGDTVYFTVSRPSSDSYAADISILDMRWIIS